MSKILNTHDSAESKRMGEKRGWFCLRCRRFVDVGITRISLIGVTAERTCRECGSKTVMGLRDVSAEDFDKLSRKFKETTDNL